MNLNDPNRDFKVTPLFDAKYLIMDFICSGQKITDNVSRPNPTHLCVSELGIEYLRNGTR